MYVFVQQLVFALVDKGIKVSVIAPQSLTHAIVRHEKILQRHTICKTDSGKSFDVYRPFDVSFGNKLKKIASLCSIVSNRSIYRILDDIKPDVLYGHFWDSAYRVKDYAIEHKMPLFVACGEGDNALEELVETISPINKEKLVAAVTGVISVSSENKRKCVDYALANKDNTIVLPNCVDMNLIYPRDGSIYRDEFGLKQSDFVILFVGVFNERKGPSRLAKAITKLNDQNIKVAFVGASQVGKGDDPNCAGIFYKGKLAHEKISKLLACSDVFVLPTLKEGCSNAIVEALASGIPVISSDGPFNDDILNENNSIRVDSMDVDAIANAIQKMKNDADYYNKLKKYTMEHSSEYSLDVRARKIVDFIKSKI